MQKQRSAQEIRENMEAVWHFVGTQHNVKDDKTQRTCMKEYHRVVRGEIESETCIRNMKRIIKTTQQPTPV